jgi:uncharacterized membrane protein
MQIAAQINMYSGALPPPSILREYDQVVPGAAERLLRQAESQTRHRQNLEQTVASETSRRSREGLISGVVVVLGLEFVAALAVIYHQPFLAAFFGGGGPAALAGVFVYGRREQREERLEKTKLMTSSLTEGLWELPELYEDPEAKRP